MNTKRTAVTVLALVALAVGAWGVNKAAQGFQEYAQGQQTELEKTISGGF